MQIKINNLVFHRGQVYSETEVDHQLQQFAIDMGIGLLVMSRRSESTFQATAWLEDRSQVPCPVASVSGVLWRRQAATEAQKSTDSFLAPAGLMPSLLPQEAV